MNIDLSGARVLVTGAAGAIGSAVCTAICEAGGETIGWDAAVAIGTTKIDVRDRSAVDRQLSALVQQRDQPRIDGIDRVAQRL